MTQEGGVQLLDRVEIIDAQPAISDGLSDYESLELSISSGRLGAFIFSFAVAAVLLLSLNRQPDQAVPVVPSTIGTGELSQPADTNRHTPGQSTGEDSPSSITSAGNIGWPEPPADRDPSYVGRPGGDDPVRAFLVDKTLLYVNDFGRPTVVDLSTGDQREVLIAEGRTQGRFELEFGQIVSTDGERSDLPVSIGRSIGIMGVRAGAELEDAEQASIVLCIDGTGCPGEAAASDTLLEGFDAATQLDNSRSAEFAIAQLLRVESWTTEHRWTLFGLEPEDPEQIFKIPTPHPDAVIWLVSQKR